MSGPVLAESRTVSTGTGDHRSLTALTRALRERAQSQSGCLGEVHFSDEGGRRRLVVLWRSPTDLRSFVDASHTDALAFRAATGEFPAVERSLWWSETGTGVTAEEAERRAAHLREHGPGVRAFTLRSPVPSPA